MTSETARSRQMTDDILVWLAGQPAWLATLVLMVLSALENIFPPVPADVAVALGAFLAQRTGHSAITLGVACWGANSVSAAGMYYVGRYYGPEFFSKGWPRRILPATAMTALRQGFDRHGVLGVFVSRFLPGLRAGVLPFAGIAGMSPLRALVPCLAASALWYALIVGVATALGLTWESIRSLLERANLVLAFVGVGATTLALAWLWRRRRVAS